MQTQKESSKKRVIRTNETYRGEKKNEELVASGQNEELVSGQTCKKETSSPQEPCKNKK